MARLASQSQLGYYAQPTEMTALVNKRLTVNEGDTVNILDPCCGKGEALRDIQDYLQSLGANVTSYGNEVERGRYQEACKVLDYVINGVYEGLRTTPGHTLLWGNPPYDNGDLERLELSFLKLLLRKNREKKAEEGEPKGTSSGKQMLQIGAVVCLCIPQEVLKDVARVASHKLDDISVYRYTDQYYSRFRQVVLFGYFRQPKIENIKQMESYLKRVSEQGPDALPTLDEPDGKTYKIYPCATPITHFRKDVLDSEELKKDVEQSSLFTELKEMFMPSSLQQGKLKRPLLPLKAAHYAQVITSGAVDGNFGDFYMTGYTEVTKGKEEIRNEAGKLIREEYVTRPVPVAVIFSPEYGIKEIK